MTDELEARLRRADPAATDAAVHPADGPGAAILRRTIMDTDDDMLTSDSARSRGTQPAWWRRPLVVGAIGAATAGVVVVTVVAMNAGGSPEAPTAATTVTYDLAAGDVMSSCLPVVNFAPIAGASALAGTVVSLDAGQVVLEVDRWYTGGDADRVQLRGADESVALDGVEFVVGEDYLVTASEGAVMICGVSGPATPELEQLYDEWYG